MKLAALVRVSTDAQADRGGSIEDQKIRIGEWARRNGHEVIHWYGEGDRSGRRLQTSPDFVRMIDEAELADWDGVVVESADRYRRNLLDALSATKRLRAAGKSLFILQLGDFDLASDVGPGSMMLTITSMLAEGEGERFRERGKKSQRTKAARGIWPGGKAPFGFRYGAPGKLEHDPDTAEAVRLTWRLLLEGRATHYIARRLFELGYRSTSPLSRTGRIGQATINKIAHSPAYAGHVYAYDQHGAKIPGKLGASGGWDPYVSEEDWHRVQSLMTGRRNTDSPRTGRPSKGFLCANGLMTCGICGGRLWVRSDNGTYYCESRKAGQPCGLPPIRRELLDGTVRRYVASEGMVDFESMLARFAEEQQDLLTIARTRVTLAEQSAHRISKGMDALAAADDLEDDALRDLYRRRHAQLAEAERELSEARKALSDAEDASTLNVPAETLAELRERFQIEGGDAEQLRDALLVAFARIEVRPDWDWEAFPEHDGVSPDFGVDRYLRLRDRTSRAVEFAATTVSRRVKPLGSTATDAVTLDFTLTEPFAQDLARGLRPLVPGLDLGQISSNGLATKSSAPRRNPRTRSTSSARAVSMITGTFGSKRTSIASAALISRHRSKPLMSGRPTSRSTTSGEHACSFERACAALCAVCTSKSSISRFSPRNSRILGSSSTTRTVGRCSGMEWCSLVGGRAALRSTATKPTRHRPLNHALCAKCVLFENHHNSLHRSVSCDAIHARLRHFVRDYGRMSNASTSRAVARTWPEPMEPSGDDPANTGMQILMDHPGTLDGGRRDARHAHVLRESLERPESFGALVEELGVATHRWLRVVLGPDAADDALADAMLEAFRQRHRFDPARGSVQSWFFGIAASMARRHRRSAAKWLRRCERQARDAGPAIASANEQGLSSELAAALRRLPVDQRTVLLLNAVGEQTYQEIAAILDLPIGTVRSRLSRARQTLATTLAPTTNSGDLR